MIIYIYGSSKCGYTIKSIELMEKVKKKYDNKFYNNVSFSEIPQIVKNEYIGLIDDRL
jgi:thiol-disulfide isomerase/thioredoxin